MAHIPTGIISHAQRVCRLYKRALRTTEDWCNEKADFRYRATLLRHRFDQNANIKDLREAKRLLIEGEKELKKEAHYQPKVYAQSIGGLAYDRETVTPDWVLDHWDPMEKACYPKYFALREKRKKEYAEFYRRAYLEGGEKQEAIQDGEKCKH